jgi:hypothetical protein
LIPLDDPKFELVFWICVAGLRLVGYLSPPPIPEVFAGALMKPSVFSTFLWYTVADALRCYESSSKFLIPIFGAAGYGCLFWRSNLASSSSAP